jgi:hypothetical protein
MLHIYIIHEIQKSAFVQFSTHVETKLIFAYMISHLETKISSYHIWATEPQTWPSSRIAHPNSRTAYHFAHLYGNSYTSIRPATTARRTFPCAVWSGLVTQFTCYFYFLFHFFFPFSFFILCFFFFFSFFSVYFYFCLDLKIV